MTGLFEIARALFLLARLASCPATETDPGGVRCASTEAARFAPPWRAGADEGAAFLRRVAMLESSSRPVGVHTRDRWLGQAMWEAAARVGWLRPDVCPGHALRAGGSRGEGWAPRGAWGVSAAYGLRWTGAVGCLLGPAILDVPAVGAVAAAGHLRHCSRVRRTRDPLALRACWAGKRKPRSEVSARWRG